MKVYCVQYSAHAGKWIYNGLFAAWRHLGYEAYSPDSTNVQTTTKMIWPCHEETLSEDYYLMATADMVQCKMTLNSVKNSTKSFLFVQPTQYPLPWGKHTNFTNLTPKKWIDELNELDNVIYWTFADIGDGDYYHLWDKKVHTIPLAFDSFGYKPTVNERMKQFDIAFVGGWANNGFDEKRKIIIDIFSKFKDSGLNCGFFVNKNLTHQQECDLLANSRVTLNIHDAYQRILGLDTNERTFKSLGLNGALVSDTVGQLSRIFPEVKTSLNPEEIVGLTKNLLDLSEQELTELKENNKADILKNHTYVNRIEALLAL